jgi:hypothetical protein
MEEVGSPQSKRILEILRRHYPAAEGVRRHDVDDFMHQFGSTPGALLYARLFVPEFQAINGRVILDDGRAPEAYLKAISQSHTGSVDPDSFNRVEVAYLFADTSRCQNGEDKILAELIVDALRARLLALFPERRFVVEIIPPDGNGSVATVGFEKSQDRYSIAGFRQNPGGAISPALQRLLAHGANEADLTTIVRVMQWRLLSSLCYLLDDPGDLEAEVRDIAWRLFQVDEHDQPIAIIGGLHESVLDTEPTGREMTT